MRCESCRRQVALLTGNLTAIDRPAAREDPSRFVPLSVQDLMKRRDVLEREQPGCQWRFLCDYCLGQTRSVLYWIEIRDFLSEPLDWLAQLNEKIWHNPENFSQLFSRLRNGGALEDLRRERRPLDLSSSSVRPSPGRERRP